MGLVTEEDVAFRYRKGAGPPTAGMVSVLALVGLSVIVAVHVAIAAVVTRLVRVRLSSQWGPLVYATVLVPLVLVVSTLLVTGVLGLGPNLGDVRTAVFVLVVLPTLLGIAVDYVWMPAPEDVDLPETT